jgi:iron complex transport system ATP-binding protein
MMGHIPHHPAVSMTHSEVEVKRVREAMEKAGCLNLEHRLIRELSSGEQQLVAIARAIVQASPVIFLDETLSRMDLHHQMHVGKLLREFAGEGKLILLVSHDLNLSSEWSDSAVLMFEGKLTYYGKLKEALTEGNLKSLYPHTPLLVSLNPSSEAPKVFLNLKI